MCKLLSCKLFRIKNVVLRHLDNYEHLQKKIVEEIGDFIGRNTGFNEPRVGHEILVCFVGTRSVGHLFRFWRIVVAKMLCLSVIISPIMNLALNYSYILSLHMTNLSVTSVWMLLIELKE
ncbi:hypothetical protein LOAG_10758 [Loa loa]|uniref:Uncharacterized protein n=1 Tax=Loa loa TaxID=7209 RepID=A0A1S0TPD4_LOALO|nr:hypothetical protein LOAG_10758 [Loa loa]EFO17741.1 hypothetical protein LOAG_10758 [Loa loa]